MVSQSSTHYTYTSVLCYEETENPTCKFDNLFRFLLGMVKIAGKICFNGAVYVLAGILDRIFYHFK